MFSKLSPVKEEQSIIKIVNTKTWPGLLYVNRSLAIAIVVMAAGIAASPVRAADDKPVFTVKRSYKTGDINRFKIVIHTNQTGKDSFDAVTTLVCKEVAKAVQDDGTVILTETVELFTLAPGGVPQDLTNAAPVITVTRDAAGKVDLNNAGGSGVVVQSVMSLFKGLIAMQTSYLPSDPVKVGATWKINVANSADSKVTGTETLVGSETADGIKAFRMKIKAESVPAIPPIVKSQIEGYTVVSAENGRFLDLNVKSVTPVEGGKLTQLLEITALPDQGDAAAPAAK